MNVIPSFNKLLALAPLPDLERLSQLLEELSISVVGIKTSCEDCPVWEPDATALRH